MGGAGKRMGGGIQLPYVMCPALKWDFPKQGSPIRTSIRMQMKVSANESHLLLFVHTMGVTTVLGGRKWVGPGDTPLPAAQVAEGNPEPLTHHCAPPHRGRRHPTFGYPATLRRCGHRKHFTHTSFLSFTFLKKYVFLGF